MKKKRRKVNALAACLLAMLLTLELVLGSGLTVTAASKITLKSGAAAPSTVYAGHSYSLKVAGTRVKFYTSNKKIATIGATTGKMKALAPGSVKITAKSTKTGKAVATKIFKVLLRANKINVENSEIKLSQPGDTAQINASLDPVNSTDVIRFYTEDKNIATVGMTSGKVTAKGVGHTQIMVYAKATKATANNSKANKIAVVDVNVTGETAFVEVSQNTFASVKVVFDGNIRNSLSAKDFALQQEGREAISISSIKVTGDREVIVNLSKKMKESSTYTLKWKDCSASFQTIAQKVRSVEITPETAEFSVPTDITVTLKGDEGVVLETYQYGLPNVPKELSINVNVTGGAIDTSGIRRRLTFTSLQGYADVEAVYKGADGTEIQAKKVITVVPKKVMVLFYPRTIREATVSQIRIFVGDSNGKGDYYYYGGGELPDYLKVTVTPTDGFAEPAAGGLYLANSKATARIHIKYEKDGSVAEADGTIYARAKTAAEKEAEKAEQERQNSSSSSSTPTPAPTPTPASSQTPIDTPPTSTADPSGDTPETDQPAPPTADSSGDTHETDQPTTQPSSTQPSSTEIAPVSSSDPNTQ